ncbi:hypothetical protein SCLCIDRAFT_1207434 [Scleroderma citrinum Foug A]|uniref:Uncharacterized protein n=1 Tax=Scleroderma citrinum Foug A TaxID=1036808 RepID=A0A0C3EPR6_9AGAM|nr:hypothetical protein SCLCIDRAFT_1207434 [Scleroderma citrinum Foug A]
MEAMPYRQGMLTRPPSPSDSSLPVASQSKSTKSYLAKHDNAQDPRRSYQEIHSKGSSPV